MRKIYYKLDYDSAASQSLGSISSVYFNASNIIGNLGATAGARLDATVGGSGDVHAGAGQGWEEWCYEEDSEDEGEFSSDPFRRGLIGETDSETDSYARVEGDGVGEV